MTKIYSVHELSTLLKGILETRFPFVWVRGQVSNLSRPGSGHVYFTLKDEHSCLDAVWFKQMQRSTEEFNPLTGEVFADGPHPNLALSLRNGEEILCAGRITVYPPQGRLQMVVELAQPIGVGFLQQEFERLKQELFTRGWFNLERKQPLPRNPERVAVITAPSGAVIHDFLSIAKTRGQGGEIRIYPTLVQGEAAPRTIVEAIKTAQNDNWAELIVLIRGGGSLEDLWAFNSEEVARAIVESKLPVITGIGHEPDFSIADLTADVRAATPSHAAQLIWTEKGTLIQQIDELEINLHRDVNTKIDSVDTQLRHFIQSIQFLSPVARLSRLENCLENSLHRLTLATKAQLSDKKQKFLNLRQGLKNAFPQPEMEKKEIQINNITSRMEMIISSTLSGFEAGLIPEVHIFSLLNQALIRYENKLPTPAVLASHMTRSMERAKSNLMIEEIKLEAANPMQPLNRGYALVQDKQGRIISTTSKVQLGQQIEILMGSGSLDAQITKINLKG